MFRKRTLWSIGLVMAVLLLAAHRYLSPRETTAAGSSVASSKPTTANRPPEESKLWPVPVESSSPFGLARDSVRPLQNLRRGDTLTLPLPGGKVLHGAVNYFRQGPGQVCAAGMLADARGVFSLRAAGEHLSGHILLREARLAYLISTSATGQLQIREQPLARVVCDSIPREPSDAARQLVPRSPQAAPPLLQSRPGAPTVLLLDFDGATVTDPDWTAENGGNPIVAQPSTLTDNEIFQVWRRVREDFVPFNLNVTTSEADYQAVAPGSRMRIVVTPTSGWSSGAGGVALTDSFAGSGTYFDNEVVAWVFNTTVNGVAEAISHEAGHTLGLSHDGRNSDEYYSGHDSGLRSWGPIMGAAYGRSLTQWSKGEYQGATNHEEDLAILSGGTPTPLLGLTNPTGYVPDDVGDTIGTATPLSLNGTNGLAAGTIGAGDSDVFSINISGGTVSLTPGATTAYWNLDYQVELLDSAGSLVFATGPSYSVGYSNASSLPGGTYYVRVHGIGSGAPLIDPPSGYTAYGSLGTYSVSVSAAGMLPTAPTITSQPGDKTATTGGSVTFGAGATGNPVPTFAWQRKAAGSGTWDNIVANSIYVPSGNTLTVNQALYTMHGDQFRFIATNSAGSATSNPATLSVTGPPGFLTYPASRAVLVGEAATFSVTTTSPDAVSYQWTRQGTVLPGETGSSLTLASPTLADNGWYEVVATNSLGSNRSVFYLYVAPDHATPVAWGRNDNGQTAPPGGLGAIRAVAAGGRHGLALKANGTVAAWGQNDYNQTNVPAGLNNVVAIAAGSDHSVALKADGTVSAWGGSTYSPPGPAAQVPADLANVVAIDARTGTSIALLANGTLRAWGFSSTVPTDLGPVVAVALGDSHRVALRSNGTVVAWGSGSHGETTVPAGLANVRALAAGGTASGGHTLALKADGTVVAWGYNLDGQCNVPAGLTGVVAVAAGGYHSLALKADGTVVAWGANDYGQRTVPANAAGATAISAGYWHGIALVPVGPPTVATPPQTRILNVGKPFTLTVSVNGIGPFGYQWRKDGVPLGNGGAITGATSATLTLTGTQLSDSGAYSVEITNAGGSVVSASANIQVVTPPTLTQRPMSRLLLMGQSTTLEVVAAGDAPYTYAWRKNGQVIANATGAALALTNLTTGDSGSYSVTVTGAAGGTVFSVCRVTVGRSDAIPITWGENPNSPGMPPLAALGRSVDSGRLIAISTAGAPVGWGTNGVALPTGISTAVRVVEAGGYGLSALADGSMVTWGTLYGGFTPPVLTDVIDVAVGRYHGVALRANGTVVAWGQNIYGETTVPAGLDDVIAIDAGIWFTLALKADGTVVAWGTSNIPITQTSSLTNVTAISAGVLHALALKADGSVVAWGSDYAGSTTVPSNLPPAIGIAAGESHSLVLLQDGSVVGFGRPYQGQTTPPAGLTGVFALGGTTFTSFALISPAAPAVVTPPASQTVTAGNPAFFHVATTGSLPLSFQWRKNGVGLVDGNGVTGALTPDLTLASVTAGDAGGYTVVVTNASGSVTSSAGQLTVNAPPAITSRPLSRLVAPGQSVTFTLAASDTQPISYVWRRNGQVIAGQTGSSLTIPSVGWSDRGFYTVTASNGTAESVSLFHLFVAPTAGTVTTVKAWGDNSYGQSTVPANLGEVIAVAATDWSSYALRADGTVRVWGREASLSTPLATLNQIVAFAPGTSHVLLLRANGTVVSVGAASDTAVTSILRDIVGVAAAGSGNYALRADGTVVQWLASSSSGYTVIPGLSGVVSLAAGDGPLLAVKSDGTLVDVTGTSGPPGGLTSLVAVQSGYYYGIGLKSNGTVTTWGMTIGGRQNVPAGLANVVAISATFVHTLALKTDGTVVTWGETFNGYPNVLPTGLSGVLAVAAGGYHDLAIVNYNAPVFTTHPASQTVSANQAATFTVVASGSMPLSYSWEMGVGTTWQGINEGAPYSGSTTPTLTIAGWAVSALNGVQFRCVASNSSGAITLFETSNPATLTVRATRGDFNADGQSDILWRHKTGGNVVFWLMNGSRPNTVAEVTPVSTDWVITGTGDFNNDGQTDVIWRHSIGGNVVFWLMNGNTPQTAAEVTPVSTDWVISGTGDFNGDGQTDIVWRHKIGGNVVFWFMNGTTPASAVEITPVSTDWVIATTGDFNNDGRTDIVWRHQIGGNIVFWMMNGSSVQSSAEVTPVSNVWTISTAGDFNGDGKTDIVWRHNIGGNVVFWLMNGTTVQSVSEVTPVSTDWMIMP
ncbi:MAG TPA: immunoglobulin domain-containing protein [Lacunisphaera sp.]|nr:immunoglobulin domain-containing protein [Lacunisphaera sp.]